MLFSVWRVIFLYHCAIAYNMNVLRFLPLTYQWSFGFSCYFLATMNKATVNILETSFYGSMETFLLSMYLGLELLGHMVTLCLSF